jgi:iron(III) transport system permease protein
VNSIRRHLDDFRLILRDPVLAATILLVAVSLVLFILWPLYEVLWEGFFTEKGSFTLQYFRESLGKSENIQTLANTVWLGIFVSTISTFIGFLFAYADAFLKIRFKAVFNTLAILPIISPPFALSMSFIMLFGQQGFVTRSLLGLKETNIYGFGGLAVVQVLTFFPVAYLVLAGLLRQIDPAYEEAARNMGASRAHIFRTIVLPLVRPGIANSFLLVFIQCVADFGNAMVIGGNYNTLAAQIYMQSMGNYDMKGGTALATILLSISVLMFVIQKYWVGDKSYVTVTGKPSRERELNSDLLPLLFVGLPCVLVSLFILVLYVLIPYGSLVNLWGIDYTPTFKHYQYIIDIGWKPILDTTWLSLLSMPVTGVLGMVIAFLIVRKRFFGRGFIEFASLLSMAIPGTVIGVGYVLAYNKPPLVLTGTAAIIVLSFVFRSMPVGIRAGIASLQQIDPAIEEAAQDLGASSFKVFTSVTIPLIKSAFFSGLVYSFVRSMTAVSAVIFLVSASYNLLTVSIMSQVDGGKLGVAAAYSTVLIAIVLAVTGILKFLLNRMGVDISDVQGG